MIFLCRPFRAILGCQAGLEVLFKSFCLRKEIQIEVQLTLHQYLSLKKVLTDRERAKMAVPFSKSFLARKQVSYLNL
jgi:hypothetical protein